MKSKILAYAIWIIVVPYTAYQAMWFVARYLPGGIPYVIATNLFFLYLVGLATVLRMPGGRLTRLSLLLIMPLIYYFVVGVYDPDTGNLGAYALLAAGVALLAGGISALAALRFRRGDDKKRVLGRDPSLHD